MRNEVAAERLKAAACETSFSISAIFADHRFFNESIAAITALSLLVQDGYRKRIGHAVARKSSDRDHS